jgi:hypothetical protein
MWYPLPEPPQPPPHEPVTPSFLPPPSNKFCKYCLGDENAPFCTRWGKKLTAVPSITTPSNQAPLGALTEAADLLTDYWTRCRYHVTKPFTQSTTGDGDTVFCGQMDILPETHISDEVYVLRRLVNVNKTKVQKFAHLRVTILIPTNALMLRTYGERVNVCQNNGFVATKRKSVNFRQD